MKAQLLGYSVRTSRVVLIFQWLIFSVVVLGIEAVSMLFLDNPEDVKTVHHLVATLNDPAQNKDLTTALSAHLLRLAVQGNSQTLPSLPDGIIQMPAKKRMEMLVAASAQLSRTAKYQEILVRAARSEKIPDQELPELYSMWRTMLLLWLIFLGGPSLFAWYQIYWQYKYKDSSPLSAVDWKNPGVYLLAIPMFPGFLFWTLIALWFSKAYWKNQKPEAVLAT